MCDVCLGVFARRIFIGGCGLRLQGEQALNPRVEDRNTRSVGLTRAFWLSITSMFLWFGSGL